MLRYNGVELVASLALSWRAIEKETQKEYERVSEDLFEVLNQVIVAATNTSYYRGRTNGSSS